MKFTDALRAVNANDQRQTEILDVFLATGFTPLYLKTLLSAHLASQSCGRKVRLQTGTYGDLAVSLAAPGTSTCAATAVVVEWSDIDPRLGLRRLGGWTYASLTDVLRMARERLSALQQRVAAIALSSRVAVSLPSLPLPPAFSSMQAQAGAIELDLRLQVMQFAIALAAVPNVRVVNSQTLDLLSPASEREDVRAELNVDFPYKLEHASILAHLLTQLVLPMPTLKGVITDLDDTLWRGIVGEIGAGAVNWDLDHHSQIHALYQQALAALADQGILVAVASKNAPEVVRDALHREDIGLSINAIFPLEISWGRKSDAVARILEAWNVQEDSVVFVDDSPIELAEVKDRFPGIRTLQFLPHDEPASLMMIRQLRDWCCKENINDEDRLRLTSIRATQTYLQDKTQSGSSSDFLQSLRAEISIEWVQDPADSRIIDLINKTNQFNLNGCRIDQDEWLGYFNRSESILLATSYHDKFGPLGKIEALVGTRRGGSIYVSSWVLSCRAFSRRIEYRTLLTLFEAFPEVNRICFDISQTNRNKPIIDFLVEMGVDKDQAEPGIGREIIENLIASTAHIGIRQSSRTAVK